MRKHHRRWAALAGMTAASLTGFGLLGGASAAADDREELPWPVIQQRISTYTLDGFEISDLPAGLDGYAIRARSFTNGMGERQAQISWVQGPESVYGKVSVLRSKRFRSLEDLRDRNYDHLSRNSLKKVQVNGKEAYLSETSGDLFRLERPGVAVTVYLQPDRWDTEELLRFAESVRPQRAAQGGAEAPVEKPAEKPVPEAKPAEKPAEKPAGKPVEKPADKPVPEAKPAEKPAEKPAADTGEPAEKPVEKPAEKPAAEAEQAPKGEGSQQQDGAPAPQRPAGQQEPSAPETEVPPRQERPGEAPAAESGAEPVAEAPAEDRPGDAPAEQKPAGGAGPALQEGALDLPEGTTPTEIRVCLLEELGGKALTEEEVAASRDAAAFTVLWEKAGSEAQWEALETCLGRLQSSSEQVDVVSLEEGALAEEPAGAAPEPAPGEAASGAGTAEGSGTAEGTPAAVGPRVQVSGPDAAAWNVAPWTLPSDRMTD
ncbi:hypothetical protein J0910_24240 [Nocardiopsis sp. CNT-189]|uniref:hypothetical protein n=1 Tax=Nocardiopsis oceanisediminis TaxID=2816862 RepID=UPI003B29D6BD